MKVAKLSIVCVILMLISLMFASQSSAPIDPLTCVGMWLFEEGKGKVAKDSSGNGNEGKLMNDPKWVDGNFGTALEFDGVDDYVEVADDDSLDITDGITLVAWVKPTVSKTAEMFMKGSTGATEAYEFFQGELIICWRLNNNNITKWTINEMTINNWNHIAAAYDKDLSSDNMKMFINALQDQTTGDYTTALTTNDHPFVIGAYPDRRYPFQGLIDEVAIFNVALTYDDIKSIMTKGLEKAIRRTAVFPAGKLATTWANIKAE